MRLRTGRSSRPSPPRSPSRRPRAWRSARTHRPRRVFDIVLGGLTGDRPTGAFASIVWDVRMPRILLGAVVGAGLAVAGTVLQALVRTSSPTPSCSGPPPGPPPEPSS
ncbi:hypothetical protein Scinn_73680 [Streptomyces virginiae]|uniref:Uncharacterized protein n=1 Tax=Streptomyces virginiae TaxID=1961 RepID=A0ABQ3NYQ3_STRVG|nr:hypothetical protein Scinn_73680 [Streptomyces virginiae]